MLRILQVGLLVLMGGVLFAVATDTLGSIVPSSDMRHLAATIERNQAYRQDLIIQGDKFDYSIWMNPTVLAQVAQFADPILYASDCLSDSSRASVSVQLGLVDQAFLAEAKDRRLRELVAQAYRVVAQRLKCSPIDGNAWLLRARLAELEFSDLTPISPLLDLSYLYAPAEKWIVVPRLRFIDYLIDTKRLIAPPSFASDLQRFTTLGGSAEVAELYAGGGSISRGSMRLMIDSQRLDRRVQILRRIDALGVSYPVPLACQTAVANGIPGSELGMRRPADLIEACAK